MLQKIQMKRFKTTFFSIWINACEPKNANSKRVKLPAAFAIINERLWWQRSYRSVSIRSMNHNYFNILLSPLFASSFFIYPFSAYFPAYCMNSWRDCGLIFFHCIGLQFVWMNEWINEWTLKYNISLFHFTFLCLFCFT